MDVNGNDVLWLTHTTTSTHAAVRLRWDAAAQRLYYEYDADGPAGGFAWSLLTSKVLNTGSSNWGMNASSSFVVGLIGESENIAVAKSDNVWLDNFKIAPLPKITTQPIGQTVSLNASASFSVTATPASGLTYQWQKDGGNIAGATQASYTIASAQSSHAGTYTCVVSNTDASVTSNGTMLTGSSSRRPLLVIQVMLTPSWAARPPLMLLPAAATSPTSGRRTGRISMEQPPPATPLPTHRTRPTRAPTAAE